MIKIPTIKFVFDRRNKCLDGRTKGYVDMVISYDRKRKFIATGVSCYRHQWCVNTKKNIYVSGTGADVEINGILLSLYQRAYKVIAKQIECGKIDISAIPSLLRSDKVDITFLDYIVERTEKKNVVDYTKASYKAFYNKLSEYGKIKFFSDITEKSIRDFDEWLHSYSWVEVDRYGRQIQKQYSQPTIGAFHKNMKAFISDAVIDGFLSENVYISKGIKIDKGGTRIDSYLTAVEVECISDTTMPTYGLSVAKDLFLIQCYTGLSYIDLVGFDYSVLRDTEVGEVVSGERHKTHTTFSFVYTDKAKEIIEKYNYRLPKLSNQQYNVRLKMVADACGIDKALTSHVGRRSCGSIWLNSGIPIEIVSRCMGHNSVYTTQKSYAKILDETIKRAFAKIKK